MVFSIKMTHVSDVTDKYFTNSRMVAERFGDKNVTYATFIRRKVICAIKPALDIILLNYPDVKITRLFEEGQIVPAGKPLFLIEGSYIKLSELETLWLQKVGMACVSAWNAYSMCNALPLAKFMDMHARHGTGQEMNELVTYGASVGSEASKKECRTFGFVGTSQDCNAHLFGMGAGMGTTPHALIGYAGGDVLECMKMFAQTCPDSPIIALVDFNGKEYTDALRCAKYFYHDCNNQNKMFGVRLDTHGGRFAEDLNYEKSVRIVEDWLEWKHEYHTRDEYEIVELVLGHRAFTMDSESGSTVIDKTRRILFGTGVSAASIVQMRVTLDQNDYWNAKIVASSGFDMFKCEVMGAIEVPIDMVGTGSFLPKTIPETYATADIIKYDNEFKVKVGREHLFKSLGGQNAT